MDKPKQTDTEKLDLTKFNTKGEPRQRKQRRLQHFIFKVVEYSRFGGHVVGIRLYSYLPDLLKHTGIHYDTIRYVIKHGQFNKRGKYSHYNGVLTFERVRVPMYGIKKVGFIDIEDTEKPAIMSSPEYLYKQMAYEMGRMHVPSGNKLKA